MEPTILMPTASGLSCNENIWQIRTTQKISQVYCAWEDDIHASFLFFFFFWIIDSMGLIYYRLCHNMSIIVPYKHHMFVNVQSCSLKNSLTFIFNKMRLAKIEMRIDIPTENNSTDVVPGKILIPQPSILMSDPDWKNCPTFLDFQNCFSPCFSLHFPWPVSSHRKNLFPLET